MEPHESCPIASSTFFAGGKGKARPVIDYRDVNVITKSDAQPIPNMGGLVDKLDGAKYYFAIDMRSGYNNLKIREGDE